MHTIAILSTNCGAAAMRNTVTYTPRPMPPFSNHSSIFDNAKGRGTRQQLQKLDITSQLAEMVREGAWERAASCQR